MPGAAERTSAVRQSGGGGTGVPRVPVVGQPNAIPRTQPPPILQPDQPGLRDTLGYTDEDGAAAGGSDKDCGQWTNSEGARQVKAGGWCLEVWPLTLLLPLSSSRFPWRVR